MRLQGAWLLMSVIGLTACRTTTFRVGDVLPAVQPGDRLVPVEILKERVMYEVLPSIRTTWVDRYTAIRIHTAAGLHAANIVVPAGPGGNLRKLEVMVTLPDGRRIRADTSGVERLDLSSVAGPGGYSRSVYVFSVPHAVPGCTIEIVSSMRVPTLMLNIDDHVVRPVAVRSYEVSVKMPKWVELDFSTHRFRRVTSAPSTRGIIVAKFIAEDVPAATALEGFSAANHKRLPYLRWRIKGVIAPAKAETFNDDWGKVVGSKVEMLGRIEPPPDAPELPEDPVKAAGIAWNWVNQKMVARNPTMRLGSQGGPARILRHGVGTEDEMAEVLFSVLKAAKHDVEVVLVPGAYQLDVGKEFFTPVVLNYDLLLRIGKESKTYLDPYCRGCEIGQLALQHQGRVGLRLTGTTTSSAAGEVHETPKTIYDMGASNRWLHMTVGRQGTTVDDMGFEMLGSLAGALRWILRTNPKSKAWRDRHLRRHFFSAVAGGVVEYSAQGGRSTLWLTKGRLIAPMVPRAGTLSLVSFADTYPERWMDAFTSDRKTPVVFSSSRGFSSQLTIRIEPDMRVRARLKAIRLESRFGVYERKVSATGRATEMDETLSVVVERISVPDYAEWRAFVQRVQAARREALVLEAKTEAPVVVPQPLKAEAAPS